MNLNVTNRGETYLKSGPTCLEDYDIQFLHVIDFGVIAFFA